MHNKSREDIAYARELLKGLYHRRVLIQVCLQIDPESMTGLSQRDQLTWNEIHSKEWW